MSEPALRAAGVRRTFGGVTALAGVDLEVQAGTVHGLIGPNGSGKTTFFDVLCGFVALESGRIEALGRDLGSAAPAARVRLGVGRTFQLPNVILERTVFENVLLGLVEHVAPWRRLRQVRSGSPGAAEGLVHEVLADLQLDGLADEQMADLPYGSQRLADLARVLVSRPAIMLLDEPAAGMSGRDRQTIRDAVVGVRARGGTVMVVEHDMRFIMEICDRITVLSAGTVIADAPPAQVASDPLVISAYLGESDAPA